MPDTATQSGIDQPWAAAIGEESLLALVVAWSAEADRVGQVFLPLPRPGGQEWVIGRGPDRPDDPAPRLQPCHQRPGAVEPRPPLADGGLSRVHLRLHASPDRLTVTLAGRGPLVVDGRELETGPLEVGSVLDLRSRLVLVVVDRPARLPPAPAHHPFGEPDADGIVGESAASWALRRRIEVAARRPGHVLVHGPSGSGKELVAAAIHRQSARGGRPLVARNAATIPESLADAELFGHAAGYPNPGMPARPGLVGDADRSSLFLDEIGDLGEARQAHLLRVLDAGEYQPLGASARRADVRLIAATHKPLSTLRTDFLARFPIRVDVPRLGDRPDDVPLLVGHLLGVLGSEDPVSLRRFVVDERGRPRVTPGLITHLVRHRWTGHVRELRNLLWNAVDDSPGAWLDLSTSGAASSSGDDLDAHALRVALDRHGGNREATWRALGLSSRHQLYRLLRKHGLG